MTTLTLEVPDVLAAQFAELAKSRGLALNEFILLAAAEKWTAYEEEDMKKRAVSGPVLLSGKNAQSQK
jgi:hypothetical protein